MTAIISFFLSFFFLNTAVKMNYLKCLSSVRKNSPTTCHCHVVLHYKLYHFYAAVNQSNAIIF
jgi:hypothetical protein